MAAGSLQRGSDPDRTLNKKVIHKRGRIHWQELLRNSSFDQSFRNCATNITSKQRRGCFGVRTNIKIYLKDHVFFSGSRIHICSLFYTNIAILHPVAVLSSKYIFRWPLTSKLSCCCKYELGRLDRRSAARRGLIFEICL